MHSWHRFCALILLALSWFTVAAAATGRDATPSSDAQTMIEALSRANKAVVGIQAVAADGARSAETLGRKRSGSGVVIDREGLVLTIGYLILEADSVELTTEDGKSVPARVVAYDLATGFGLLKPVVPLRVAPVSLGSYRELSEGEPLMVAVGGDDADVSMTQLVSKRAFSGYWEYFIDSAIFTSPPVSNHSGAPLFNSKGELMGIGSLFTLDALGRGQRVPGNMFVSVDLLKPILAEMQQTGSTRLSRRAWLGVTSTEQSGRVQIMRVTRDSPASAAGLQPGDVVLAVDSAKVSTLEMFYKKLWERPDPQAELSLTVLQGADIREIRVRPVDRMATMRKPSGI